MDGLQTMRALTDAGSQAPVVFLSMLDDEETVVEAFRRGGRGYVLKPHVGRHLANALDHVSQGRLFAPSLTSLYQLTAGGPAHVMQLHGGQPSFLDAVASLFDLALQRGDATCVIGTTDIRDGLAARLRDRGWDIDGHQRYRALDAAEAVDQVMRNGLPDAGLLANTAAELEEYRVSVTEDATGRLAIFGNMVAILKAGGNTRAVMALESLWSSVTHALPFFTVCGYDSTCFHDAATDLWSTACGEHGAVSQAS
jgi:hypothetical protein